ncbi:MAG: cupin domain-containing protein, partial [Anaerolineales bacterium]|nr:cupin domain-containing protein [Anaerolineales bacterium]
LEGQIEYEVENKRYLLEEGDSLMFLAYRKHRWRNAGKDRCRALVLLFELPPSLRKIEIQFLEDLTNQELNP